MMKYSPGNNSASALTRAFAASSVCAASTKCGLPSPNLRMQKGRPNQAPNGRHLQRGGSGVIIASIWRVGSRCANYKRRRQLPGKAYLPTACTPACPSCCDPALPTQITSHRTESTGSSSTSSTSCPRLSLKLPRNLNPSCDLSTMRHGSIV